MPDVSTIRTITQTTKLAAATIGSLDIPLPAGVRVRIIVQADPDASNSAHVFFSTDKHPKNAAELQAIALKLKGTALSADFERGLVGKDLVRVSFVRAAAAAADVSLFVSVSLHPISTDEVKN